MNNKITTGIWFIFFGVIFLLHNFSVINFNFFAMLKYWPLLIIAIGANLILQNKANGTLISGIINLVICIFLAILGMTSEDKFHLGNINLGSPVSTENMQKEISIPLKESNVHTASLEFSAGATKLILDSANADLLLEAKSTAQKNALQLVSDPNDNNIELIATNNGADLNSKILLNLNTKPIWKLDINLGASSFVANLSHHKFRQINLNSGATSIVLTLGEPTVGLSTIEVNTAASSLQIKMPHGVACMIENDSFLSGETLKSLPIKEGDISKTTNYDSATNKYLIKISGAANSMGIDHY